MLRGECSGVKLYILFRKCSGVKVSRNINNEVKYRYVKILPKYSSEVFCTSSGIPNNEDVDTTQGSCRKSIRRKFSPLTTRWRQIAMIEMFVLHTVTYITPKLVIVTDLTHSEVKCLL